MNHLLRRSIAAAAACCAGLLFAGAGTAAAAFPNFSDCPRMGAIACLNIKSKSGSMTIKSTTVPLGDSLELRGGLIDRAGDISWAPPAGTNGFFTKPVKVPGGLLGIDFPIPGNTVTATAKIAGPASSIRVFPGDLRVQMPLKLELSNPILGPFCQIGSNSNPAWVDLIIGTTSPPPPNRPITGSMGEGSIDGSTLLFRDVINVDNSFAIPSATGCGIGLGLVNGLINLKLGLPSAAGNNTLIVRNDAALLLL